MSKDKCDVCGLRQDQIPPIWRYETLYNGEYIMKCRHQFGIPAINVPDWRTHDIFGNKYPDGKTYDEMKRETGKG